MLSFFFSFSLRHTQTLVRDADHAFFLLSNHCRRHSWTTGGTFYFLSLSVFPPMPPSSIKMKRWFFSGEADRSFRQTMLPFTEWAFSITFCVTAPLSYKRGVDSFLGFSCPLMTSVGEFPKKLQENESFTCYDVIHLFLKISSPIHTHVFETLKKWSKTKMCTFWYFCLKLLTDFVCLSASLNFCNGPGLF